MAKYDYTESVSKLVAVVTFFDGESIFDSPHNSMLSLGLTSAVAC